MRISLHKMALICNRKFLTKVSLLVYQTAENFLTPKKLFLSTGTDDNPGQLTKEEFIGKAN